MPLHRLRRPCGYRCRWPLVPPSTKRLTLRLVASAFSMDCGLLSEGPVLKGRPADPSNA